jgi:hypothetical protein
MLLVLNMLVILCLPMASFAGIRLKMVYTYIVLPRPGEGSAMFTLAFILGKLRGNALEN